MTFSFLWWLSIVKAPNKKVTSCVGFEDLAAGQTIRNDDILLNNIEKKQDFKLPL